MAPLPLTDALTEGGERILALVEPLSDADVEAQHIEIMSPLAWDLAHIAAYEELWLVHRHGGAPLSRPRPPARAAPPPPRPVGVLAGVRAPGGGPRRPAAARPRGGAHLSRGRARAC